MTFDPTSILSDAEKFAIAHDRAKTWAREAFSHQLNKEAIEALPESEGKTEQLAQIDAQLTVLTKSVEGAVTKGDAIKADIAAKAEGGK